MIEAQNLDRKTGIRRKWQTQDVGSGANLDYAIIFDKSDRYLNSVTTYWYYKIHHVLARKHNINFSSKFSIFWNWRFRHGTMCQYAWLISISYIELLQSNIQVL